MDFDKLKWRAAIGFGDAAGVETDELLILMNRDMALAFDRTTFRLWGLYDPASNHEYVLTSTRAPAPTVIDKIVLLKPNPEGSRWREITITGLDDCRRRHAWRSTPDGIELVLFWERIGVPSYEGWDESTVPTEPGVVDVVVRVSIEPEGMSRWSCRVLNRSADLGLQSIQFPMIGNLKAWDEEDPVDFSASGQPRPTDKPGGGGLHCLGYQAYYGRHGGVYYQWEDPEYLWNDIRARTDAEIRTATFSHEYFALNHRGEQVKRFEATYPIAVGIFHGDWYTAARIYRRWAIRQPWCAKGTLAERNDLPDWFKQREFFQQGGGPELDQRIARHYGRPVGIWWTTWMHYGFDDKYPDYFPPKMGAEAFKQAIARGHELGLHYMPYVNVKLWDYDAPSYNAEVREAGSRFIGGPDKIHEERFVYGTKDMHAIVMCPATKLWQDKVSEIVRKLIQEYDCDGVYFDQLGPYAKQCSHPDHGHPQGGGNCWVEGMREILRRARQECMAAGKKVVFSGESWREQYIGYYDAALWVSTGRGRFIKDVIYHDYLATICGEWHQRPVVPYVGSLFIAGQTIGPLGLGERHLNETPDEKVLGFLHYLSDCRREFGLKYVNLGARLRNPRITTPLPTIDAGSNFDISGVETPVSAVITSAWEAGDGDIGCFFMNISDQTQEFTYDIDLATFELDRLGKYAVTKRELGRQTPVGAKNSGWLTGTASLESGRMMMFEFSSTE